MHFCTNLLIISGFADTADFYYKKVLRICKSKSNASHSNDSKSTLTTLSIYSHLQKYRTTSKKMQKWHFLDFC